MSNKFEIILEAGLDKDASAIRIARELAGLSKDLKVEVSPTLKKDLQKEIDTMNSALKKASDVKITPKVDTTQVEKIATEITSLDKRQINLDFSKIDRQFAQVIDKSKDFKKDLKDLEKVSINVLDKGSYQDLRELKMSMKELREFGMKEKPGANAINRMVADMDRLKFKFSDTIEQSNEMNNKMETLSNTISKLSSSDSDGISKAKLDIRDMGVELKELEKSFKEMEKASQKSNLFEISGREDMIRGLNSLKLQYKDVIGASDEYKRKLSELERTARSLKFDDVPGQKAFQTALKDMRLELRELNAETKETGQGVSALGTVFQGMGNSLVGYIARIASLRFVMSQVKDAFSYVKDIDKSLTEIAMVTNQSVDGVQDWGNQYRELARELRVSNVEMTEGAVGFVRQGLEQADVMDRLAISSKFAKITAIETAEATELLTATVNGMGVDIERASDVMIYMGDSTATSGQEIAKGLQKTAGTAGALGVEFEKVSSWIATISAQTRQAPETVGATINSILSRMSKISSKGFDEGDGTSFNDVAKALDKIGVAMMDNEGYFRNYGDILDDVAGKWDDLTQAEKQYVGTQLAGTHRLSNFFQLMDSYSDSLDLYHDSLEAGGTTHEKYEIFLESVEAKLGELKGAVEDLFATMLDSGAIHQFIDMIIKVIEVITELIDKFGGLQTALGLLSAKKGLSLIAGQVGGLLATGAAINPIVAGLGAILALLPLIAGGIKSIKDAKDDMQFDTAGAIEGLTEDGERLGTLQGMQIEIDRLNDLKQAGVDVSEKEVELGKELAEIYPELADAIDKNGDAYVSNLSDLDSFMAKQRESIELELKEAKVKSEKKVAGYEDEIKSIQDKIVKQQEWIDLLKEGKKEQEDAGASTKATDGQLDLAKAEMMEYRKEMREVQNALKGVRDEHKELEGSLDSVDSKMREFVATSAHQAYQAGLSEKATADWANRLMQAGYTSEEASLVMKYGFEVVEKAMENARLESYNYIMGLDSMNSAEANATQNLISQEVARTRVKIEQTQRRIQAMKAELQALQALHGGSASIGGMPEGQLGGPTNAKARERATKHLTKSLEGQIKVQEEIGANLSSNISKLEEMSAHVGKISVGSNVGTPDTPRSTPRDKDSLGKNPKGTKGKKKKDAKKKKDEYQAEVDYYAKINALLDKNSSAQERNNIEQKLAGDNISKKIQWMNKEIKLEEQRQKLLHSKAQMLRAERADLEKQLKKQGFKFDGDGDDKLISNITNLKGKSKETEEAFKRFFDIQTKELPPLSNEWMKLKDQINEIKIDRINLHMEIFNREAQILEGNLKDIQHRISMIDDMNTFSNPTAEWDTMNDKLTLQAELYEVLGQQVSLAQAKYEQYKQMGLDPVLGETKEYIDELQKLKEAVQSAELAEFKSAQQYKQLVMEKNKMWIAERNKEYDEQRKRLSALDSMQEEIVKIIKKRGDNEKKELDKRHKEELKMLDKRQKEYEKAYKKDLDRYKKLIQDKLDALKDSWEEEDYQEQLQKEREALNDMLRDLAELSLDDSLNARAKAFALQKKIDEQQEKIAKLQKDKERKDTEKLLKDKLKGHEDAEKEKNDLQKEAFENEKEMIKERQEREKEALNAMYENNRVYAEARQALMADQVKTANGSIMSVQEAVIDFNREFGKIMGIMGDVIQKDFIDKWNEAGKAMSKAEYMAGNLKQQYSSDYNAYEGGHITKPEKLPPKEENRNTGLADVRPKDFEGWSDTDFHRYLGNKKAWTVGGKQQREAKAIENADLREKYWGKAGRYRDEFSYEQLEYEMERLRRAKMIAGYRTGGFVPRDGYVMAHEKEMFVPDMYQRQLWEFIQNPQFNIPNNFGASSQGLSGGDVNITIPVEGNLDEQVLPDLERTIRRVIRDVEEGRGLKMRANGIKIGKV